MSICGTIDNVILLGIQNCATEGFGLFETHLAEQGKDFLILQADHDAEYPNLEEVGGVIIGGTPISAYTISDHPFLQKEAAFLEKALEANKPCLGICFGAQALAQLLGAKVRRNERMEIGCYEVRLTSQGRRDPVLNGFPSTFPVFHWHGDTFEIPPGADLLAEGDDCRNQMFRRGNVIGIQFHLEVTHEEAGKWAERYVSELRTVGKTENEIVAECREKEAEMDNLAGLLVRNFLALGEGSRGAV